MDTITHDRSIVKNKKPQVPGKCIFCSGLGMSKQHLWPNWMGGVIPEKKDSHYKETISTRYDTESNTMYIMPYAQKLQGPVGSKKIRNVCRNCNHGWIERLENDARPVLERAISKTLSVVSASDQINVSRWASLMTIMSEFTDLPTKVISYAERKYLMDTGMPPATWGIWIGRVGGEEWRQEYKHDSLLALVGPAATANSREIKPNTQTTILILGEIFILIISSLESEVQGVIDNLSHTHLIKIWPNNGSDIQWESLPVMTNDVILEIKSLFEKNLESHSL